MKYRSVVHFLEKTLPSGCEISSWTGGEEGFHVLLRVEKVPALLSYEQVSEEWCYTLRIFGRAFLDTEVDNWKVSIVYSKSGLRGSYGDPLIEPKGALTVFKAVEVLHLMERYRENVWSKRKVPKSVSVWMKATSGVCYLSAAAVDESSRTSKEGMTSLMLTVMEAFNCLKGSFGEISNDVLLVSPYSHHWWLLDVANATSVKRLLPNAEVVQVE